MSTSGTGISNLNNSFNAHSMVNTQLHRPALSTAETAMSLKQNNQTPSDTFRRDGVETAQSITGRNSDISFSAPSLEGVYSRLVDAKEMAGDAVKTPEENLTNAVNTVEKALSKEEIISNYVENNVQQYDYKDKEWGEPSKKTVKKIKKSLMTFDAETLQNLDKAGVKCLVMKRNKIPQDLQDRGLKEWRSDVGAMYAYDEKLVLLRQDALNQGYITHEFGHAVDDMLMQDQKTGDGRTLNLFKSESDPELLKLYDAYMKRTEDVTEISTSDGKIEQRDDCWSEYARTKPREYVAEGVRMYLGSKSEKKKLSRMDPGMYDYIGRLMESSRGNIDVSTIDMTEMAGSTQQSAN